MEVGRGKKLPSQKRNWLGLDWGLERKSILQNSYGNVLFTTGCIGMLHLLDRRKRREEFMVTGHWS